MNRKILSAAALLIAVSVSVLFPAVPTAVVDSVLETIISEVSAEAISSVPEVPKRKVDGFSPSPSLFRDGHCLPCHDTQKLRVPCPWQFVEPYGSTPLLARGVT